MRENTLPVKEIHVHFQPALDKKHSHPGCNLQGVAHIRGWHSVDIDSIYTRNTIPVHVCLHPQRCD